MYAVSISLGSSSAVVSIAFATSAAATEATAPIKVTANSAGHRSTPVMSALADHDELLFGEDARALYARTPNLVVPYLFAFAAVAEQQQRRDGANNDAKGDCVATRLRSEIEGVARRHYKGCCSLVNGEGDKEGQLGFLLSNQSDKAEEKDNFVTTQDVLVEFFNHVKKHSVDGACGLITTTDKTSLQEDSSQQDEQPKIILTIVVPRYLFQDELTISNTEDENKSNNNNNNNNNKDTRRCDAAAQWVRKAIMTSHLGAVSAHVSLLFSDEAALLAMDAVSCRPHPSHPMSDRYFLLPPSASSTTTTGGADGVPASPWPYARVLVVDWGALGVSLTCLRLEGGCLVEENNKPLFLRACQGAMNSQEESTGFATTSCGGGDAVTFALRETLSRTFAQQQRRVLGYQSLSDFPARAQRRLLLAAEEKKVALSKAAQVPVEIEALAEGVDLRDGVTFSRVRVDAALRGEWKFIESFEKVLAEYLHLFEQENINNNNNNNNKDGGEDNTVIDAVVLCGGMLQMPCISQSLRHIFTQRALAPGGEAGPLFARNLVIMEAGTSTTLVGDDMNDGGKISPQSVANRTIFGAEELSSVGGCLHSYHLALAALNEREHGYRDNEGKGKNGRRKFIIGRKKKERAEVSRRVWRALTLSDTDNRHYNEVSVLKHPILLYTQISLDTLCSALALQKEESAPLQIPRAALSVLFAAHTLLPARVFVPLAGTRKGPFALYLFMGSQEFGLEQEQQKELSSVFPLNDTCVTLPSIKDEENDEKLKNCIAFTLQESERKETQSTESECSTVSLQLVIQLVRIPAESSESLVLSPNDVRASVTLNLGG